MKKIFTMIFVTLMAISTSIIPSFAYQKPVIPSSYFDENGNYENPETGEYFRWEENSSKATAGKNFSFNFRYYLESSSFTLGASNVKVKIDSCSYVDMENSSKDYYKDHKFSVDLQRWGTTHNAVNFVCPRNRMQVKDLGGGFSTTASYNITLVVLDELPVNTYIRGKGSVMW